MGVQSQEKWERFGAMRSDSVGLVSFECPPRDHFPCTRRGTANLMRVKSRENWERFGAVRSERRVGARAESLTRGGLCFRREVANVTEAVLRWAGLEESEGGSMDGK